jgi:hypothetical protein
MLDQVFPSVFQRPAALVLRSVYFNVSGCIPYVIGAALFESKLHLPKKIWRAETMPVYSVLRVITDNSGLHASGPRGIYSRVKA